MISNEIIAKHFADDPVGAVRAQAALEEILRAQADARPVMWVALTDEDRKAAFESLPDMLEGFLKKWGWLNFAKEIERRCKEKNADFVRDAITHTAEASAPGLSDDEWLALAEPNASNFACYLVDHCEGQTVTEELVLHWLATMMNSPQYADATVGEPSDALPVPVAKLREWLAAFSEELAAHDIDPPIHHLAQGVKDIQAILDGIPQAAQQQAEPGADERAAQSVDDLPRVVNSLGGFRGGFIAVHGRAPTEQEIWNGAVRSGLDRAARAGQRAGVAEGWKVLPENPTMEMRRAGNERMEQLARSETPSLADRAFYVYKAMLDAAPTQQQEGGRNA